MKVETTRKVETSRMADFAESQRLRLLLLDTSPTIYFSESIVAVICDHLPTARRKYFKHHHLHVCRRRVLADLELVVKGMMLVSLPPQFLSSPPIPLSDTAWWSVWSESIEFSTNDTLIALSTTASLAALASSSGRGRNSMASFCESLMKLFSTSLPHLQNFSDK